MLGHVAQFDSHETGISHIKGIRRELSEVIKEVSAPCGSEITSDEYRRCTANNYNTLLYSTITPFLAKRLEEGGRPPSFDQIKAFSTELAFKIILDYPLQYVSYIANVISGMWSYTLDKHTPIQHQLDQCIPVTKEIHERARGYTDNKFTMGKFENQRATNQHPDISLPTFEQLNYFIDNKRKLLKDITLCLSLLAIALVFFKQISRPHRLFLLSASLSLWAYYLLVAMMQPGISRYLHAFEPVAWTIILSSLGIVLSKFFEQINLDKRRGQRF